MATILVLAVVLLLAALVAVRMVRNKKKGRISCGCGCEGCSLHGSCRRKD